MLGAGVITRFNPRIFETMLLTMLGIILVILKFMNDFAIGKAHPYTTN